MEMLSDAPSESTKVKRPLPDPFIEQSNKFFRITDDEVKEQEEEKDHLPDFFCQVPGCQEFFQSTKTYNDHYNAKHRHVCGTCKKHLPTGHLLDIHLQETHDSYFKILAERKPPMFQCLLDSCSLKFNNVNDRFEHCLSEHSFPLSFRCPGISLGNVAKKLRKEKKSNVKDEENKMEIVSIATNDKTISKGEKIEIESSKKKEKEEKSKQKREAIKTPNIPRFGQSSTKVFIPRKCFAVQKDPKSNSSKVTSIDMSEMEEALKSEVQTEPKQPNGD